MKNVLYVIYAIMFYFYSIIPLNKNKTTFIMTHDVSINGNIMCMYRKVKEKQPKHICKFITKSQFKKVNKLNQLLNLIKFIVVTPCYLATSKTIFLDNVFLPMAYIKFKQNVNIVQLWHGCNTLKKFGQLSNTGILKELERRANSTYTHVVVSSKKMIQLHKQAFGVDERILYPVGLPRMDIFFDSNKIKQEKEKFFTQYNELRQKRILLYTPTFRDNDLKMTNKNMNLSTITKYLPDDFIIITKFHPFVVDHQDMKWEDKKCIDMSKYEDLNRLLLVSDILITDYSSIVFDFAVLNKPIIFYAYDKEHYKSDIRGFYYNYEEYIESKIVNTKEELIQEIINMKDLFYYRKDFINKYIDYFDSNSASRVYNLVYITKYDGI